MNVTIDELIELGDVDELLREIDRLCDRRDWPGLLLLRDKCRRATERGKQLWGAAGHAEYRLALEGTAEYAAPMADAEPGRFVLGPLAEVMASTHSWDDLAPYLPAGPHRALVAYERVLRDEDLSLLSEAGELVDQFGLPLVLQNWEPKYVLAEYKAHEALFPAPELPADVKPVNVNNTFEHIDDPAVEALAQLTQVWTSQSNGRTISFAARGGISDIAAALEVTEMARIDTTTALAYLSWAGASGGAHGVRAGAAAGRAKLWWALANLAGVQEEWPLDAHVIGDYVDEVAWWTWNAGDLSEGWSLRVAIVDPADNIIFVIDAFDRPD